MKKLKEKNLYWLVGIIEGEGCFMKGAPSSPNMPTIQVSMTDKDVMSKVASILGTSLYEYRRLSDKGREYLPTFTVKVKGAPAVEWMESLRPLMGRRRQEQIDVAMSSYEDRSGHKLDAKKAEEIRELLDSGKTQKEIADQFGVTQPMISRIKTNRNYSSRPSRGSNLYIDE